MNILITGHHSLGNRGCEAILRSTVSTVRSRFPSARFWVPSSNPQADGQQWPDAADSGVGFIEAPQSNRFLRAWARSCRLAPFMAAAPWPQFGPPTSWRRLITEIDLTLSIGGDNYTMDYGLESLGLHVGLSAWSIQQARPVVLWGASVGPFDDATPYRRSIRKSMVQHLRRLHGISVRESLTARHLQSLLGDRRSGDALPAGPTLVQVADPAFNLRAQAVDLEPHWPKGSAPVLGVNISPLVLAGHGRPEGADANDGPLDLDGLAHFIRQRCASGGYRVVLIPHVSSRNGNGHCIHSIAPQSDDDVLLDRLMERLQGVQGLGRIPVWDAPRIKYAISQCDFFIGARTHSVIAALSSLVPTVALAYSMKAHGIHLDLFGHEQGVVPSGQLSLNTLNHALDQLVQRSSVEREHLLTQIPIWRAKALQAIDLLPEPNPTTP